MTGRLTFLDGLRGWGAIVVLFYHVLCQAFPAHASISYPGQLFIPLNGPLAVSVFFIVSGFSLSIGFLESRDARGLVKIAAGRYLRLAIPIFATCLIVHLVMIASLVAPMADRLPPTNAALNFESTWGGMTRFALWDVFFNYDLGRTYAGPLWTMRLELMGSAAVFAAIVVLARPTLWRPAALFAAGLAIMVLSPTRDEGMIGLFPIGAALADCFWRGWLERVPLLIAAALLALGCVGPFAGVRPYETSANLVAVALTAGCLVAPAVRAALSGPFAAALGRLSFPLYLIHGPVIVLIGEPLMRHFGRDTVSKVGIDVAVIVLSIGAGVLFEPANRAAVMAARWFGSVTASVLMSGAPQLGQRRGPPKRA